MSEMLMEVDKTKPSWVAVSHCWVGPRAQSVKAAQGQHAVNGSPSATLAKDRMTESAGPGETNRKRALATDSQPMYGVAVMPDRCEWMFRQIGGSSQSHLWPPHPGLG